MQISHLNPFSNWLKVRWIRSPCYPFPLLLTTTGSMLFLKQKPLAPSALSQQSSYPPTILILWSPCYSHLSSCSWSAAFSWPTLPSVLLPRLASFVSGCSYNWLHLILRPHYLIVRPSLATFLSKFPCTLLSLSHLPRSFTYIFISVPDSLLDQRFTKTEHVSVSPPHYT